MQKIKGLDTLRAFAVIFVLFEHMGSWFNQEVEPGKFVKAVLLPSGNMGVDLFFVLSGFLITSNLLNAKIQPDGAEPMHIIKNFFIRRALRIFPIYYLLVFVLFLINFDAIREVIWYCLTYTLNIHIYNTNAWCTFSHTWTLDIEEQFYLIWPWLVIFVPTRYFKLLTSIAIIIGVGSTYYTLGIEKKMGHFMMFNCLDAFGLGALYAGYTILGNQRKKFERWALVAALIAWGTIIYWNMLWYLNLHLYWGTLIYKFAYAMVGLGLIILVINNKNKILQKYLLENRLLNYIGRISYGIYLYHYIYMHKWFGAVGDYIHQLGIHHHRLAGWMDGIAPRFFIQVTIVMLLSALSYQLIELPFLSIKDKFFSLQKKQKQ